MTESNKQKPIVHERYAFPAGTPDGTIDGHWGYVTIFKDGSVEFEDGNPPKEERLHTLKTHFLNEV